MVQGEKVPKERSFGACFDRDSFTLASGIDLIINHVLCEPQTLVVQDSETIDRRLNCEKLTEEVDS